MNLKTIDIQSKEFSKTFRGYNQEEVDDFLDQLAKSFDDMVREKMVLEEDIRQLEGKLDQYHKLENTLHNSIIVAQETAEDVKRNANKEAELIRREAERDAQRIMEEARYKASRVLAEHEGIYKQSQVFKLRFRSLIEAQLASLELEDWLTSGSDEDNERLQLD